MAQPLDQDPSLLRAIARAEALDAERRDLAFLAVPARIGGLDCLPLTPHHLLCLFLARSPFLCGGRVLAEHVAQFLWIVSPGFRLGDPKGARAFARRIAIKVRYTAAVKQIDQLLEAALADRPAGGAGPRTPPIASFAASLVHEFAWAYGWPAQVTLHTPLAQLYQLLRYIVREENPKAPLFAGSADKVKGAWLRRRAARRAARAPGLSTPRPPKGAMTSE